jgi:cleavage and polyadenylation specificity factor subunit 1
MTGFGLETTTNSQVQNLGWSKSYRWKTKKQATNSTFADPYLLIQREDSSVKIYKATGDGEVEDVEASGLSSTQWLSASLFQSSAFTEVFAFLLTPEGGLRVFAMSQLEKPCFVAEALSFLPPLLTMDYVPRRSAAKATITEILAADLGDATSKSPHLIVSCIYPEETVLSLIMS